MMDNKELANFLINRDGALEILLTLFYAGESSTIDELWENLSYNIFPGELPNTLTDMAELGLIKIEHKRVSLQLLGEQVAESLLEGTR